MVPSNQIKRVIRAEPALRAESQNIALEPGADPEVEERLPSWRVPPVHRMVLPLEITLTVILMSSLRAD